MAARRGLVLSEEHRDCIATGQLSMNELAGQLGTTRQNLHVGFKRRGWRTTPIGAEDNAALSSPAECASPGSPVAPSTKARQRPARARSTAPASSVPRAPIASPWPPQEPAAVEIRTADEMVEHARRAIAAVALATLDRAHEVLSKPPIGAQAIKACIAASVLATDQLARAGFDVAMAGEAQAPRMIILEMTAAEVEAKRAEVEEEHRQNFGTVEDDDELPDDEQNEAVPRQRAA